MLEFMRVSEARIQLSVSLKLIIQVKKDVDYYTRIMEIADIRILKEVRNKGLVFAGGLHGLEHVLIGIMSSYVTWDRCDIGGVSVSNYPFIDESRVFLYDGFEGGIGLTEKAFQLTYDIFKMTYELVRDCQCEEGCPACIYSSKCGNENRPLDKGQPK